MKTRDVVIFTGEHFEVPQGIQRIDHRATHGWQLRYGGTKLYSDGAAEGGSATESLKKATAELLSRIAKLPAPTMLQQQPNHNKTSDLPVGISGPIVRLRKGARVRYSSLSVLLPRFGEAGKRRNIYIGTENTFTIAKYHQAVEKAIQLRTQAEEAYQRSETRAKRAAGKALQARQREALAAK